MALPEGFGKQRKGAVRLLSDDAEIPLTRWARGLSLEKPKVRSALVAEAASKDDETINIDKEEHLDALRVGDYAIVAETAEMVMITGFPSEDKIAISRCSRLSEEIPKGALIIALGQTLPEPSD